MTDDAGISIADLTVRYPGAEQPALDGISMELQRGTFVGLVGLTGAGKSTLLRCLNGIVPHLDRADVQGYVRVAGMDPVAAPVAAMSRRVGMVLDDPESQVSQATAAEEVALGLESQAVEWPEMVARVADALAAVGLDGQGDRPPTTLSGGEQQRLAIACAIALRPSVLLMDEPTAQLDPAGKGAVFELIRQLNRDQGLTVVMAEHDMERLAEHADRIVAIDRGHLVADGSPPSVLGGPTELPRIGVRGPQVTQLAAALAASPAARRPWPVTLDEAIRWLAEPG